MADLFQLFEKFSRGAHQISDEADKNLRGLHPFESRNIENSLPAKVKSLFDNGHYAEATFEAFKYLDKQVAKKADLSKSGEPLMMEAFREDNPKIQVSSFPGVSGADEQRGYKFLFAGGIVGIRNPRGHEHSVADTPDWCLDHLVFVSMLLRKIR